MSVDHGLANLGIIKDVQAVGLNGFHAKLRIYIWAHAILNEVFHRQICMRGFEFFSVVDCAGTNVRGIMDIGFNPCRAQTRHTDICFRKFHVQGFGITNHSEFSGKIRPHTGVGDVSSHRGRIDDMPTFAVGGNEG